LARLLAEGYDVPEIANRFDVARCTVYRWWRLVKKIGAGLGIVIEDGGSAPSESLGR
jgi:transposase